MVFFTCNACGESLKKAQVEKHLNICRNCKCLSCIDCGKDFCGEGYKNHLKCISEDQKYGGKGFEAKANKGDVKQQQWIQKIHEVMKKPSISPKLRDILNQISTFDNIPRKKAKFQNWMKNSLKIHDQAMQDKVWEIFSEANSGTGNPQEKQPQKQPTESDLPPTEQNEITAEAAEKKKSKRERKEERQKNNKKEKKELKVGNQEDDSGKKKGKKRGKEIEETVEDDPEEIVESNGVERKKKKKHQKDSNQDVQVTGNGHNSDMDEQERTKGSQKKRKRSPSEGEPYCKQKKIENQIDSAVEENEEETDGVKGKFNWKGTIKAVLKQAPDNEMTIKKLRKKVLAQYYSVTTEHHKSEADVLVTFNKKISCNPKFKVLKEKVKLMK